MKYLEIIVISLAVTLGGIVAYQKFVLPKKERKIYIVDTEKLIAAEKRLLRMGITQGRLNADEVKTLDLKFKKIINYIAQRDNAIVYVKKAILSDNYDKDITNEVLMIGISK